MSGRRGLRAFVAALWLAVLAGSAFAAAEDQPPASGAAALSADTLYASDWIALNGDNHGAPYAIVDKRAARLSLFAADGQPIGTSPVLLGLAPGDRSIPDIAERAPASLAPSERTTPAGRFESTPGHNDKGEDIVWIDYGASLAIHRLRPSPAAQHRGERMASANPKDKRISFGCVVVPVAFYDDVVKPLLGQRAGVVYVLPETRPVQAMFDNAAQFSLRTP